MNRIFPTRILPILFVFCIIISITDTQILAKEPRPEMGVRALGLAGAFTSNSDGVTAALWNPAGLAKLKDEGLVYNLSHGALSFAYPIEPLGTFGFSFLDLNNDKKRLFLSNLNNPIGKFKLGYNQILFSYARRISSSVMAGANFGLNRIPFDGGLWQKSYDFGIITELSPKLSLGVRIADVGGTPFKNQEGKIIKQFYQQFSVGTSWTPNKYFSLSSDFDTAEWKIRTGAEIGIKRIHVVGVKGIYLRSGSIINLKDFDSPIITAGLSIHWQNKQLNYAYINDNETKYKHLLSVGFRFGSEKERQSPTLIDVGGTDVSMQKQIRPPVLKRHLTETQTYVVPEEEHQKIKSSVVTSEVTQIESESEIALSEIDFQIESESKIERNDTDLKEEKSESEPLMVKLANKYNLELPLILAVIETESMFNPNTVSKSGAVGLMQLMPYTARCLGLKTPIYKNTRTPIRNPRLDERFDPKKNLEAGMKYLKSMIEKYDGNYVLALCAYNAGPSRVDEDVPDIRETEKHVGKVLNRYYEYKNSQKELRKGLDKLNAILGD